jgi:hypothetical protein
MGERGKPVKLPLAFGFGEKFHLRSGVKSWNDAASELALSFVLQQETIRDPFSSIVSKVNPRRLPAP